MPDFGRGGSGYGSAQATFDAAAGKTSPGGRSDSSDNVAYTSPKGKVPQKQESTYNPTIEFVKASAKFFGKAALYNVVTGSPGIEVSTIQRAANKFGITPRVQRALTPAQKKKEAKARLSGSPLYTYTKKTTPTPTGGGDNGGGDPRLPKPKILTATKPTGELPMKNFFNFRAYKDGGGVKSGPPPKSGPNPQVPPVKMRKGKMTKSYKFSCPSRPDGIRGMGAAMKGHKFTGVK